MGKVRSIVIDTRIAGALALAVLASGTGCNGSGRASAATPAPLPQVTTIDAERGTIHPTLQIAGVVTPYRQVGIAANLSEPIADVDVQEGDHVRAGQPLAHLVTDDLEAQLASNQRIVAEDVARYSQTAYQTTAVNSQDEAAIRSAQATLHQAQVSLAGARTDLARYTSLAGQGYLPNQTLDQQRTTVASDVAAVNSAQAALNQAVAEAQANGRGNNAGEQQQELASARAAADAAQASVEQLRRQISRAVITSPIDGVVDAVNANPGEYPSGRQLFTIEQLSNVYVALPSSSAQVVQVRNGAPVTVTVAGITRTYHGTVAAVLDQLQPGSTNFTVRALVPNPDGSLHAGLPVTAVVALPPVDGIEIPVTAFIDDTHAAVYTVSNGVLKSTPVHEVKDDGKNAIVTGLPAGTHVVQDVEAANAGNGDRVTTKAASK